MMSVSGECMGRIRNSDYRAALQMPNTLHFSALLNFRPLNALEMVGSGASKHVVNCGHNK